MQDQTEKISYGLDWLQKGIYGSAKLDDKCTKYHMNSKKWSRKPWKPGEYNWQQEEEAKRYFFKEMHYHIYYS